MIDKSEYAKWLTSQMDFQGKYHNHKETMAWVATAFYLPGIIVLSYKARDIFEGWGWRAGSTLLVLVLAYIVFVFVKMQFDMRWQAADVVAILMRRIANFNRTGELPQPDEWIIDKKDQVWPHFVQCEIYRLKAENRNFEKAFQALKKIHLWWRWDKHENKVDDRWKTELPSYIAIFLTTAFSIYFVLSGIWN